MGLAMQAKLASDERSIHRDKLEPRQTVLTALQDRIAIAETGRFCGKLTTPIPGLTPFYDAE